MATYSKATSTGNYTLYLSITESSVDEVNNTSNVTYSVYFVGNSGTSAWGDNAGCTATVAGSSKTVSGISYNMSSSKTCYLITNQAVNNIAHNEDGTKTISFSVSFSAGSYVGTCNLTGTFDLTTIARDPVIKIKINGAWKSGKPWVKVNGTWKKATKAYVKISGAWKEDALKG